MATAPRLKLSIDQLNAFLCHWTIPAVLWFVLCTTLALAQASPAPPKPGPEAEKIGAYVGKWHTEAHVPTGAMGSNGGKTTGTISCDWIADRFGVFCRENVPIPGGGSLTDVYLMAYDEKAKNYFFTQVSAGGVIWTGRGTVNGDTWVWTVDSTADGKPIRFRFTEKWTSPDSYDFKNEVGESGESMKVMMEGKETRVRKSVRKPTEKK
ncbi:MAG: DUF1579 family protein [Candidatus Acidiferrales bacterium]